MKNRRERTSQRNGEVQEGGKKECMVGKFDQMSIRWNEKQSVNNSASVDIFYKDNIK